MTTHGVLVQNRVAAENIDSYNRSAVCSGSDIDNGNVFRLVALSSTAGQNEVWNAQIPIGGSLNDLWMAYSPELVVTKIGNKEFRGLSPDPRDFTSGSTRVFDAFKPVVGDIISLSADAISGSPSTGNYVVSQADSFQLVWIAVPTGSALQLKFLKEEYFSIADGGINTQRITSYRFYVLAN
jgi:hypothetical protein